jgi:hypothetical protein
LLKAVRNDAETYTPTTTIFGNVKRGDELPPEDGSDVAKFEETWISYGNGAVLDSPSLVTPARKNKFVGCDVYAGGYGNGYAIYYTDTLFAEKDFVSIEIEEYIKDESGKEKLIVTKYDSTNTEDWGRIYFCTNDDGLCYGVQTYDDWSGVDDKECNVTITFNAHYEDKDRFGAIRRCRFGTVFGAFGNSDRLFLSGNPDIPNIDFYSLYNDYTQFTESGRTVMGSDDIPITGYIRLSDSVLATFKKSNATEPTIYYRSATEVENSEGYTDIEFTRWAGGINEGCVNPHTVVNLAGDDIFVSPNGVYGVVQVQNTSKNDRYIRQRDIYINAELRNRDLSDAVSFVYRNRYYLSLGNGECYVADPRYKNYLSEDIDGSFNYEWWKWTNVPARVFANVDGELWFGDNTGRICRFDDKFCDRTYYTSDEGTAMVDRDIVYYDTSLSVGIGDIVKLTPRSPTSIYCKYLSSDEIEVVDGGIKCLNEMINKVYLAQELYTDSVGSSGLVQHKKYIVSEVDRGNNLFRLKDEDGKEVYILCGGFSLHRSIGHNELRVSEVNNPYGTFKISDAFGAIDISNYAFAGSYTTKLEFTHIENVCSEWYTPVFDLGAPYLHKTLHRLNVTIDPNVRGSLQVGYETNDKLAYIGASAGKVFSFDDFSFNDFSFTTGFTATQSQKVKARNFNYIMFRFVSDNDADCAIDNFSAEYTYNGGRFAGTR